MLILTWVHHYQYSPRAYFQKVQQTSPWFPHRSQLTCNPLIYLAGQKQEVFERRMFIIPVLHCLQEI